MQEREVEQEGLQSLAGKCVLITGGTTGIGRATARLLSNVGAKVFIFGRHQEALDDALSELSNCATEVAGTTADQARPEDIERVFSDVDRRMGGLDILINNAAESGDSVTDSAPSEWMYVVQANLIGYMLCTHHAYPRLKQRGEGRIVCVGSMSAKIREEGSDVYVATKGGIEAFSDSLGKTVAKDNISVTLIEPGLISTELSEMDEQAKAERISKHEMLHAEDVARTIAFALSQPIRCSIPLLQVRPRMQLI